MKKSYNHFIGILLAKQIWFLALGVVICFVLVYTKNINDTAENFLLLIAPFFIIGVICFLLKYGNSISFEGEYLIIKNIKGDKYLYSKKHVSNVEVIQHNSSGVLIGFTLVLTMRGQTKKVWKLSGYPEDTVQEIISILSVN
ncbi:hypothetical protein [Myroides sp. LoEW2-1]|uniref:hypothetical protein n=1 Tax=Myroides sp. LoEW2-1 TaxID=2683192 RepID=UPI001321EC9C|nr:hypothetical protein [Myroides sp. LoEW2-1]MVX37010.1 hypothetical protein [Myroides sp. LoEW2-1]